MSTKKLDLNGVQNQMYVNLVKVYALEIWNVFQMVNSLVGFFYLKPLTLAVWMYIRSNKYLNCSLFSYITNFSILQMTDPK